jgi:RimJ/RimL family protein N-acetyltransferase
VPEDAPKVLEYVDRVSGETDCLAQGRGELGWTLEKEREFIEDYLKADNKLLILAEIDDEIAGAIGFTGGERKRMRHSGELGIAVVKEYWGLGIGTALMECLIVWARSSGIVRKITLRSRIDNERALRLYEHFGFVREGIVTRLFEIAGEFYDGYLLGLEIDP